MLSGEEELGIKSNKHSVLAIVKRLGNYLKHFKEENYAISFTLFTS